MKWIRRHKIISGLLAVVALIIIIVAASSGGKTPSTVSVTETTQAAAPASSAVASAAPDTPAPDTPAPSTTDEVQTAPALTTAEQQAVDAAQNYLDLGTGFSYNGLLKQLTSSYGNGFSAKDAKFAISYLKPDWNAQAVEAAKGYLKLGGFSRASLIQQLTSSYGSGFTEAQAEYAAGKVGL
jgi:3-oxoacyl-ACP reductase-like protein